MPVVANLLSLTPPDPQEPVLFKLPQRPYKMNNWIIGFLLLSFAGAFVQNTACTDFKDGKFKLTDAELGDFIIERKGAKQVEYSERHKMKLEFNVEWLNECTYTLKLNRVLANPDSIKFTEGLILTVEIVETTEGAYVQRTSSNLYDVVVQSELVRVE